MKVVFAFLLVKSKDKVALLFRRFARIFFPHVIFENVTKYQYFIISADTGAAAGGILFFLTYIPYMFLQPRYADLTLVSKLASSLISNVAMSYGGQVLGMFEGTG